MEFIICCIKDRAVDAYNRPFFARAKGEAMRLFTDEINREQSDMFKHADDYDLYFIGTWNDQTATFKIENQELLARGKDVKDAG